MNAADISTDLGRRRRVCVIGNSYIGALKRAHVANHVDTSGLEFAFFATPIPRFSRIEVVRGCLTNIEQADAASQSLHEYDMAVIYGDFPTPAEILQFAATASENQYSGQLRRARLENWLLNFSSFRLCRAISALSGPRVFLLSRNMHIDETNPPHSAFEELSQWVKDAIFPAIYIPPPPALLTTSGKVDEIYSKNSLNILGQEPDRTKQPEHHNRHLNQAGGAIVLTAIRDSLLRGAAS